MRACLVAFSGLAALSACNTVEGIGADLTAGGLAIERAATNAQAPQRSYPAPPPGSTQFEPGPNRDPETGELAASPNNAGTRYNRGTATYPPAQPSYRDQPIYLPQQTYPSAPPTSYEQPTGAINYPSATPSQSPYYY